MAINQNTEIKFEPIPARHNLKAHPEKENFEYPTESCEKGHFQFVFYRKHIQDVTDQNSLLGLSID